MQVIESKPTNIPYKKVPVSISELNKFFQQNGNEASSFNQVERDFRQYVA